MGRKLIFRGFLEEPEVQVGGVSVYDASRLLERTIPKMVSIELDLEKEVRLINADSIQVEQILLNLGRKRAGVRPHDF